MTRQKEIVVAVIVAVLISVRSAPTDAAEPSLVEAARREGKLVAYVSMLTENATALLETFAKIRKAGAPIEWVLGRNPIPASTHLLGI